nr:response regulator [Ardenticatena sp.]
MSTSTRARKVMIVEDDAFYRRMLEHVLTQHGYVVVSAENADDAWRTIQDADDIHIVLTDWVMPEYDGLELIQRLRSLDRPLYIILLTIEDNVDDVLEGLTAGADDYLAKPFTTEGLLLRLRVGQRLLAYEWQLRHSLASLDQLKQTNWRTGLLNRYGWFLRAKAELNRISRQQTHAALFLLAIGDPETLRANFGDEISGRLLVHVAHILEQHKREYDILGHWDEASFVLFLPETEEHVVRHIADRVRRAILNTPLVLDEQTTLQPLFSLGITTTQWSHTYRLERLLHDAHLALSEARMAGPYHMRMFSHESQGKD